MTIYSVSGRFGPVPTHKSKVNVMADPTLPTGGILSSLVSPRAACFPAFSDGHERRAWCGDCHRRPLRSPHAYCASEMTPQTAAEAPFRASFIRPPLCPRGSDDDRRKPSASCEALSCWLAGGSGVGEVVIGADDCLRPDGVIYRGFRRVTTAGVVGE